MPGTVLDFKDEKMTHMVPDRVLSIQKYKITEIQVASVVL